MTTVTRLEDDSFYGPAIKRWRDEEQSCGICRAMVDQLMVKTERSEVNGAETPSTQAWVVMKNLSVGEGSPVDRRMVRLVRNEPLERALERYRQNREKCFAVGSEEYDRFFRAVFFLAAAAGLLGPEMRIEVAQSMVNMRMHVTVEELQKMVVDTALAKLWRAESDFACSEQGVFESLAWLHDSNVLIRGEVPDGMNCWIHQGDSVAWLSGAT